MSEAQVPPPPHPDWPVWQCELEALGESSSQWTVGDKYLLKCEGSKAVEGLSEQLRLAFPIEELSYTLHLLELKSLDSNQMEAVVTSYKPGKYRSPWIEVQGENSGFRFENLEWQVGSVIEPGSAPPQPHYEVPALGLNYPLWMWGGLVLAFLLPILWLVIKLHRRSEIRNLVESLAASNSALRPYDQFSKEVRSLVREHNYHQSPREETTAFLKKMNDSFKVFLTREIRLPAHQWRVGHFVSEMKKVKRGLYKDLGSELRNLMHELNKAEKASQPTVEDADQLKKLTMKMAERIFKKPEERAKR